MNISVGTSLGKRALAAALALALAAMALAGCAAADQNAPEGGSASAAPSTPAGEAGDKASDTEADAIEVGVSVAMPEGAKAASQTATVAIPKDGTVYDALVATGWDVQADDGDYGKYVTAINGVANGSVGETSGWVFTVNNEQVMEGCGTCKLADGDIVEWIFFV